MKMALFLFIILTFQSCGKMNMNAGQLTRSTIIGGRIQPLSGLISQHSNQKSFLSNAYAAPCTDAVTASLYTLSDSGEQSSAPVMTYDVKSDAEYSFDLTSLGTLDPEVQYIVEVTGCDYLFSRPVTAVNLEQDINYATTFISFATNANLSKNLREVLRTELDEFLKQMQGNSFNSVQLTTNSNAALTAQFQSLFGSNISALNGAAPKIVYYRIPSLIPELTTGSYEIKTIHPDPAYNTVYKWKLDGALKSSAQLWNYYPTGNDQGTHLISLYVGQDDGSGNIDISSRYLLRTFLINVPNNITPIVPNISTLASVITNPNIQIDMDTGFALSNCDSFEKLALTENMTAAPSNPALYNITCTQAVSQAIPFTISTGNGLKVLRLWAMDSSGAISTTPKILNVTKTEPSTLSLTASTLSLAASSILSGSTTTITLTVRDSGNNILVAGGETVTFAHAGGISTATFSSVTDNANGTYTATLTGVVAGAATGVNAYIDGNLVTSSQPALTVQHGAMNSIDFSIQPSPLTIATDTNFTIQPIINAYDANNNLISTDSTSSVSLSAYDAPACAGSVVAGGLGGSTSRTLSSGIGSFTDIKILSTSVRSIKAAIGTKTICSNTLGVNPGPPASLAFTIQPGTSSNADSSIGSPVVTAYDSVGNIKTDFTGAISLIASSDAAACGATSDIASSVSSPSQTAVAGVATFSNLRVTKKSAFKLRAFVGGVYACSNNFSISPGAVSSMSVVSGNGQTGDSLAALPLPIVIAVKDAHGNGLSGSTIEYTWPLSCSSTTDSNGLIQCTWILSAGLGTQTAVLNPYISVFLYHDENEGNDIFDYSASFPMTLTATATYPSLAWDANTHSFGNIFLTANSSRTFTLTNSGNKAATCSAPTLGGTHGAQYSITNDSCGGNSLAAGASCTVDVISTPTSVGTKTATLSRVCSFGGTVATTANGLTSYSYSATTLKFNPTSKNFSSVPNGTSSGHVPIIVTNSGASTALSCSATISGTNASDFSIGTNGCGPTLAAGASCNIQVQATPGAVATRSGIINFMCLNGSTSASLSVTGITPTATHTPLVTTIALGNVVVGRSSSTYDLYLTNSGETSTAGCSAFTNTNNSDFTITDVDCGTSNIAAGQRCLLKIQANPAITGARTSTLSRSCTTGGATGNINLSATGMTATPTIAPILIPTVAPSMQPQLSAGDNFTCTLLSDGRVSCWGNNGSNRLGNGTIINSKIPVIASVINGASDANTAIAISSGYVHTCALMKDYTVKCWGDNNCGTSCSQVGNGSVAASISTPTATSLITGVSDATKANSVSAGLNHTCAVMFDGKVKCWGSNAQGQLGDGTYTDSTTPIDVANINGSSSATFATGIEIGGYFSCATMANGTIKCWGYNYDYRLGNNSAAANSNIPVNVGYFDGSTSAKTAIAVSLGSGTACAVAQDTTVRCWGDNGNGVAGINSTISYVVTPTLVVKADGTNLTNVTALSTGKYGGATYCARTSNKEIFCWGYNSTFNLGNGTLTKSLYATKIPGISTAETITVSRYHGCTTLTDKSIKCWGGNYFGELGDNSTNYLITPNQVPGVTNARSTSYNHIGANCVLKTDGAISCWGTQGLGNGSAANTYSATPIDTSFTAANPASMLSSGGNYQYAVDSIGYIQQWGQSTFLSPTDLGFFQNPTQIAGNSSSRCILRSGTIYCWGEGTSGQLGDGGGTDASGPTTSVFGITDAIQISAGNSHYCAILSDRTIKCWGENGTNQIGDGTTNDALSPLTVYKTAGDLGSGPLSNVYQLALNNENSCALLMDGTVKCWGRNLSGQIGDNTALTKTSPTTVKDAAGTGILQNVTALTTDRSTVCALIANGRVYCWGSNTLGAVGNGRGEGTSASRRLLPTPVAGLPPIASISSGKSSSISGSPMCASALDGRLFCWGDNALSGAGYDESQIRTVNGF